MLCVIVCADWGVWSRFGFPLNLLFRSVSIIQAMSIYIQTSYIGDWRTWQLSYLEAAPLSSHLLHHALLGQLFGMAENVLFCNTVARTLLLLTKKYHYEHHSYHKYQRILVQLSNWTGKYSLLSKWCLRLYLDLVFRNCLCWHVEEVLDVWRINHHLGLMVHASFVFSSAICLSLFMNSSAGLVILRP